MKLIYILGLDKADMKKIQGFRLRLVNLFFPSLIEILKETASDKATYQERWLDKIDHIKGLLNERNKLTAELNELKGQNSNKPKNNEKERAESK